MNGVFYPCCQRWHPSSESHRTGPKGECVLARLKKHPLPSKSPAPAQMSGYYTR